jgi:hypothetical protein
LVARWLPSARTIWPLILKREAVLINVQRIRFLGESEPHAPPEEKPQSQ